MARKKNTVDNGLGEALLGSGYNPLNSINNPMTIFANATNQLLTLNWVELANTYKSNGFCRIAVDLPVADAFRDGGFDIDSKTLNPDELLELKEKMSDSNDIETLQACLRFGRLYGGSAVVISTNGKPERPLIRENLYEQDVVFLPVDRWQCYANGTTVQLADSFCLNDNSNRDGELLTYDKSKVLTYTGQLAPYYLRNQLSGWGMSIFESVIPQLRQYIKANGVILELLDEAKIDILKIDSLAQTLLSAGGTQKIQKRLQIAADNKNYKSMLAMDSADDYQQKTLTFAGLHEMLEKIFLLICASLRMPYSKVFGRSQNGLGTGENLDNENYLSMIEAEIRQPATKILKQMIDVRCWQLFGRKIDDLVITWKPLKVLNEIETQQIETQQINNLIILLQNGVLTKKQVGEQLTNKNIILFNEDDLEALDNEDVADFELEEQTKEVKNGLWGKLWNKK